jgi:hypothetical protein
MLVARVVQDQGDGPCQAGRGDLAQQRAHRFGIDVLDIGYPKHLMGDGIQGRQNRFFRL